MLFYNAELIIIAEQLSKWENLYLSEYAHVRAKKNVGWKIFLDKKTNALNICFAQPYDGYFVTLFVFVSRLIAEEREEGGRESEHINTIVYETINALIIIRLWSFVI